jgi:hypothetical protein
MRLMPFFSLLALTFGAPLALGCAPIVETRTSVTPISASGSISVNNPHGAVHVRHTPEGEGLRVVATLAANDGVRLASSHVIIQTSASSTEIFVAWAEDGPLPGESVDLVVEVPRWVGVRVQTDDGDLQVVGLDVPVESLDVPVEGIATAW